MDAPEYMAFLPLLIYGIALADLLSEWKRFFSVKKIFIPYLLLTIVLTELALYNVFAFAKVLDDLDGLTYFQYLYYLIPPFLFMLTVNAFTPDKDRGTEEYFMKEMPVFFTLLSLYAACHFLYEFGENLGTIIIRGIAIVIVLLAGIFRKLWLFYMVCILWFIMLFVKGGMIST